MTVALGRLIGEAVLLTNPANARDLGRERDQVLEPFIHGTLAKGVKIVKN